MKYLILVATFKGKQQNYGKKANLQILNPATTVSFAKLRGLCSTLWFYFIDRSLVRW